tara:strand:- start:6683 stop:7621 length:939 start_codon:yes stop_codon:yes gene_type:complete
MGDLSDYEKQRLANIAKNNAMLQQLGIQGGLQLDAAPQLKPSSTRHKEDKEDDSEIPAEPTRRSARVANLEPAYYGDIDREEKKILQMEREERKAERRKNKRPLSHVRRYDDDSMNHMHHMPHANQQRYNAKAVFEPVTQEDIDEVDNTPSHDYLKMLRHYCFQPSHLEKAGYPATWVAAYKVLMHQRPFQKIDDTQEVPMKYEAQLWTEVFEENKYSMGKKPKGICPICRTSKSLTKDTAFRITGGKIHGHHCHSRTTTNAITSFTSPTNPITSNESTEFDNIELPMPDALDVDDDGFTIREWKELENVLV